MAISATKTLILMRHAKSDWHIGPGSGGRDIDRPLNARGVADSALMASWLAEQHTSSIHILSSPAKRAQQTADAMRKTLKVSGFESQASLYLAELTELRRVVREAEITSLLLIGHNPGLEEFVEFLSPDIRINTEFGKIMPTCAVYAFELSQAGGGKLSTRLLFHQRPKLLR